ncbi:MAG: hypothetical protein PHT94_04090 [Candidatus Nanoarchaeia archaeon]|nr:hypothetical protein [Candidatus Nanoarchaeia archaeon]
MAKKDNTYKLKTKFNGPCKFFELVDFIMDLFKSHGFKVIEDSFEKENTATDTFKYTLKYSGSKDDKPWTKYEFKYSIKGKNVTETKGEIEIEAELKIDYINPYKSKSLILSKINDVEKSIYKEKEKYLEDIFKELQKGIREKLDEDFV